MKYFIKTLLIIVVTCCVNIVTAATNKEYTKSTCLAVSQLGFRPNSKKHIMLVPSKDDVSRLPNEMKFYVQPVGARKKRNLNIPELYKTSVYNWPYHIDNGSYLLNDTIQGVYQGVLHRVESRWGVFWQGDFSDFTTEGIYQIETEKAGFSTPFAIDKSIYNRFIRSYLLYNQEQRSGCEVAGIRPVQTLDDAILDTDSTYIPCAGGWFDAGDIRKWMSQTLGHLEALSQIALYAHPAFREASLAEIAWGNKYFHAMINEKGQVYEDVGAGSLRNDVKYEEGWWCENHAGCGAKGTSYTDNIPETGDERTIRTTYNPAVQFLFIRAQSLVSRVLQPADAFKCRVLAEKAWLYSVNHPHDNRTLFVALQLEAILELYNAGSKLVCIEDIMRCARLLMNRQDNGTIGLSHYFTEINGDGYRSVVWSMEPIEALLKLIETKAEITIELRDSAIQCVRNFFDNYLLKDAESNPFGITPWGIISNPEKEAMKLETYRDAGRGKFIRTFIQIFNSQRMPHGGNATLQQHTLALIHAGRLLNEPRYIDHAERLIQWSTGYNPYSLCLFQGVGFRHPVQASFMNYMIPDAALNGFIGNLDDTPYIETSNAIDWNTQEVWGVPFYHLIMAISYIF